jgi:hypothetical protein
LPVAGADGRDRHARVEIQSQGRLNGLTLRKHRLGGTRRQLVLAAIFDLLPSSRRRGAGGLKS